MKRIHSWQRLFPKTSQVLLSATLILLLVLVAGIWLMAWRGGHAHASLNGPLLLNALATAACIAGYTLADALGARSTGDAIGYALWLFVVNGLVATLLITLRSGPRIFLRLGPHWRGGLGGGAMSMLAYSLVIWATTQAPVAMVSALRETSIVFALLIGVTVLGERLNLAKVASTMLTLLGAALLRAAR